MTIERRAVMRAPELRAGTSGVLRTVSGYAAVFDVEADIAGMFREVISPGAFRSSLADGDDIRAYLNHDSGRLLGRSSTGTLRLREDVRGLAIEIDLPDTTDGRDLVTLMERGDVDGMSFGFMVRGEEWDFSDELPRRRIMDVQLFEVSPVTAPPAYDATTIGLRAREEADKARAAIDEARRKAAQNYEAMKIRHRIKQDLAERQR